MVPDHSSEHPSLSKSLDAWITEIREANARGELLQAFDLADHALEDFPANPELQYNAVLALARAGATNQARNCYERFKLGEVVGARDDDKPFLTDVAALDARIAKDEALEVTGRRRGAMLGRAAERYEAIFRRGGDYYTGINAATLALLSGDAPRAESLARKVLNALAVRASGNPDEYYARATQAEAHLIFGTWTRHGPLLAPPRTPPAKISRRWRLPAASFDESARCAVSRPGYWLRSRHLR